MPELIFMGPKFFLAAAFTWYFALSCLSNGAVAAPSKSDYNTPNKVYFSGENTTADSTLAKNRKVVLDYLAKNSSFYVYGSSPDTVYGFYECYTAHNCSQCFSRIIEDFSTYCPLATGCREYANRSSYSCFLRYETNNFFDDVNTEIPLPLSPQPAAAPPTSVNSNSATLPPGAVPATSGNNASSGRSNITKVILGVVVPLVALSLAAAGLATYVFFCKGKRTRGDIEGNLDLPRSYRYEELRVATDGFAEHTRLGQGGFGAVYKAVLRDGREVAVKKLLLESSRRKDEFLNEIKIISSIQHRNLVRLEGYCEEAKQRVLVLEYFANGSLDKALFGKKNVLDWPARRSIIFGIAGGLGYLHEESHIQIIHRDIKASNVLLDNKLNPKIADFGISKLYDKDASFTTATEVIGTYGYLAPEYAIGGILTAKIDVFSFGVLVLEIVSGRRCNDPSFPEDQELLLEWAWNLHSRGLLEDLIDPRVGLSLETSKSEALRAANIALLCTQEEAAKRPTMSLVVAMLQDYHDIPPLPEQPPAYMASLRQIKLGNGTRTRHSLLEPR